MLKAYSIFKDLDKKACEILRNAGIQLDISNSVERPNKEELIRLLNDYDILIIGVKEKLTILGLKKKIIEANEISIKGGTKRDLSARSNDISNSTIGIIGAGKISREVIKIAKVFNMKIYCNTLNPEKHQDLLKEGVEFTDLNSLLTISDIITVNIPLNEENKNLISKDKIGLMKKTATFINTSRAEIVDMNELMRYADENETFNVGLDIDAENYKDLLNTKRNNVIVTPHIAGVTKEAIKRMDVELANNPYIGEKNKLEFVEEEKLEVRCDISIVKKVLKRLREVHPYEEPAIDIIPLIDEEDL